MSGFAIGLLSFPIMLALICLRIPIGVAMLLVRHGRLHAHERLVAADRLFEERALFAVLRLFALGDPAVRADGPVRHPGRHVRALFRAANVWLGHRRGGLAMATIGGCAAFGAICGSSVATAATMAQVALPEMRRYGYSGALSTGTLAAGGTLGILIPPSIILVVYAHPDRAEHRQAVRRRLRARASSRRSATWSPSRIFVRLIPRRARPASGPQRAQRLSSLARSGRWSLIFLAGARRHLWRLLHADRGCRGRRVRHRPARLRPRRHAPLPA